MKVTAAYTINVRLGSVETEVSFPIDTHGKERVNVKSHSCLIQSNDCKVFF